MWGTKETTRLKEEVEEAEVDYAANNNGNSMTKDEKAAVKAHLSRAIKEQILLMVILHQADKRRYGNLQNNLANSYLVGRDEYPKTVGETLKVLNNYKHNGTGSTGAGVTPAPPGASLLQPGVATPGVATPVFTHLKGTNEYFYPTVTCRTCN